VKLESEGTKKKLENTSCLQTVYLLPCSSMK